MWKRITTWRTLSRCPLNVCEFCGEPFTPTKNARTCSSSCHAKAWRTRNPERWRASNAAWVAANQDHYKEAQQTWQKNNPEAMKVKAARWYASHAEHARTVSARYKVEHKAAVAESKRQYRLRTLEARRAAEARYRAANPDKVRAKHLRRDPAVLRAESRRWRLANLDKARDNYNRRRARKKAGVVERYTRLAIYERDGGVCGICREPVGERWEIDHIIPIARGGADAPSNVQIAHPRCNRKKWALV